jgi:hypothetical protein
MVFNAKRKPDELHEPSWRDFVAPRPDASRADLSMGGRFYGVLDTALIQLSAVGAFQ